jgi:rifampicin phosphotransferase
MARGVLKLAPSDMDVQHLDRNAIYVLPATTAELPPVAGILTTGRGNALSHVQLLARNLGIPNVGVDKRLMPYIQHHEGHPVILAVSPRGVVQLVRDDAQWDAVFGSATMAEEVVIRPDLTKLDLNERGFIPLENLRARDAGRIVGPKAANLGELKAHFPEAVTEGVAIPFGHFRALLEQPMEPGGPSAMEWMVAQYARIRSLTADSAARDQAVQAFLERIQDWIMKADPGDEFRVRLRAAMEKAFGPDGTYGVFVRSDTNVEDLPGFTGAGLNLTVPNVVGVDNVLAAISRVWASPFTERAYLWRQSHMDHPEHVYVSILLLKSVPVEKSGVMITADLDSGNHDWLSIAVNEGVGGAVSGQSAEELRVDVQTGRVRLLSQAAEPFKNVLLPGGGMAKLPASGTQAVLTEPEIEQLIAFSRALPERFPKLQDAEGRGVPADVEFGFLQGRMALFQIRPFLESIRARTNRYLLSLDEPFSREQYRIIDLDEVPKGAAP